MRLIWALGVFLLTLLMSPWAALRAYYVCMSEGLDLVWEILSGDL